MSRSQIVSESGLSLPFDTPDKMTAFCEKVFSIYSPSGDERDLARFLFSELKEKGLDPVIDRVGNVLCEVGIGTHSLLFCGHMDTVPGELPVRREGSTLYGRGACDAKGPLLSMLFAFEKIASEMKRDPERSRTEKVIFAGVTEEERTSKGLNELLRNKIRSDAAIFGEPGGVSKVTIGYRGHLPTRIATETREVHGSAPWLASNAAEVAFALYQKIKAQWPSDRPESTDSVSVALTQIHSGSVHNVTPGKAIISLDIRLPSGISTSEVESKINSIVTDANSGDVKATVSFGYSTEPYRINLNSNLVRAISRSLIKSNFPKPAFVTKSGTGDMNTYALGFGVDAITYGPGDTKLSHTNDERVDIREIFDCAKILCLTAAEFFSLQEKNGE